MTLQRLDFILAEQKICAVTRSAFKTRFAPSPTGHLHMGHAYSALVAFEAVNRDPARFCLRIDDLDHTRSRPEYVRQLKEDLAWLGISWAEPPLWQSKRLGRYQEALEQLKEAGLIYPCFLSRKELNSLLSAPHDTGMPAPHTRDLLSSLEHEKRSQSGEAPAWRLDMKKAIALAHQKRGLTGPFQRQNLDGSTHLAQPDLFGDIVIARKDIGASYHLSVVLDDADSEIDLVVRGQDLESSTDIHLLLQILLDLPHPIYHHHRLICDADGKRLAKRDDARALLAYRNQGMSADEFIALLPDLRG